MFEEMKTAKGETAKMFEEMKSVKGETKEMFYEGTETQRKTNIKGKRSW